MSDDPPLDAMVTLSSLLDELKELNKTRAPREIKCSFCGRPESEVRLAAGPMVFICEPCVELCTEVFRDEKALESNQTPGLSEGGSVST